MQPNPTARVYLIVAGSALLPITVVFLLAIWITPVTLRCTDAPVLEAPRRSEIQSESAAHLLEQIGKALVATGAAALVLPAVALLLSILSLQLSEVPILTIVLSAAAVLLATVGSRQGLVAEGTYADRRAGA